MLLYRRLTIKTPIGREHSVNKQLLDEVFVISRTIKAEVVGISQSQRLRLITLTLFILDIRKNEFNNCFLYIERKIKGHYSKWK